MSKASSDNKAELNPREWVDKYGDYLYNYALYRVSSQEKAEDLVQEAFLAALKARANFQGRSSEKTWLVSILKRKIVDHYRKQGRSKEETNDFSESPFLKEGAQKGQWKPDRTPVDWEETGIANLEKEEFYEILELCLSLLPDKWENIFRLKSLEELESSKICKEMGISSSNLWVILHRARLRLRECFEKNYTE